MLLSIDVGNSSTSFGFFDTPRELIKQYSVPTKDIQSDLPFLIEAETEICVCSVVPHVNQTLLNKFPKNKIYFIDSFSPFSFQFKTDPYDPIKNRIGADRLANAEAAAQLYTAPCIVVDIGTATTICALSANNEFLGGAILPGPRTMLNALVSQTAQLFSVDFTNAPSSTIGTNTIHAIQSGILHGHASAIDGMVQKFKSEMKIQNSTVIATGGLSPLLKEFCTQFTHYDIDLTLKGCALVYERVCKRKS